MTLLNFRGRSTTRISSFLIGRPTKNCTRPSDSLAPYWRGTNNASLWSLSNAPATKKFVRTSGHFPPRRNSFFETILPPSSEASVSSVKQGTSIVTQWDTVMSIMTYRSTGVADLRPNNGQ
ncbi:hypothetical protein TNCV_4536781 [Trichonephila clavipes]|nr:hypothetical protein TNCV_4536781 [Trichonephila clavipes]